MQHFLQQGFGDDIGHGAGLDGDVAVFVFHHGFGFLLFGLGLFFRLGFSCGFVGGGGGFRLCGWFGGSLLGSVLGSLLGGFFSGGFLLGLAFGGFDFLGLALGGGSLGLLYLVRMLCRGILESLRVFTREQLVLPGAGEGQQRRFGTHSILPDFQVVVRAYLLLLLQRTHADDPFREVLLHVFGYRGGEFVHGHHEQRADPFSVAGNEDFPVRGAVLDVGDVVVAVFHPSGHFHVRILFVKGLDNIGGHLRGFQFLCGNHVVADNNYLNNRY